MMGLSLFEASIFIGDRSNLKLLDDLSKGSAGHGSTPELLPTDS
jgi:hypothetical protein